MYCSRQEERLTIEEAGRETEKRCKGSKMTGIQGKREEEILNTSVRQEERLNTGLKTREGF